MDLQSKSSLTDQLLTMEPHDLTEFEVRLTDLNLIQQMYVSIFLGSYRALYASGAFSSVWTDSQICLW